LAELAATETTAVLAARAVWLVQPVMSSLVAALAGQVPIATSAVAAAARAEPHLQEPQQRLTTERLQ